MVSGVTQRRLQGGAIILARFGCSKKIAHAVLRRPNPLRPLLINRRVKIAGWQRLQVD